jgi:Vta1 like
MVVLTTGSGHYWIVNQILSKNLHTTDEESLAYTTELMDKLEQVAIASRREWRRTEGDVL